MDIENFIVESIKSILDAKMVVFCGAGISYDSGVPTVSQIIPLILDKLGMDIEEKDKVCNSSMPFEGFMQILAENSKVDNFLKLLGMFKQGKPNTNHILFAKLSKAGLLKTICTTNFDLLIEDAFEKQGLEKGIHYNVFHKEEDFEKIDWSDKSKTKIIKIHGSIEDKENMAVIMKRVAAKEYSEQRQVVINQVFANGEHHDDVLVLGYSCSDAFDLTPQIENVGRGDKQKNIMFLEHLSSDRDYFGKVDHVSAQEDKNPFKQFKSGKRLHYETKIALRKVWENTISDEYKDVTHKDKEAGIVEIEEWIETLAEIARCSVLGRILYEISEFGSAKKYRKMALDKARKFGDTKEEGIHLGDIGAIYTNTGKYQEAIEYHKKALCIARKIGDIKREGEHLSDLGTVYRFLCEYKQAIDYYKQALKIAQGLRDIEGEGARLGNLGIVYSCCGKYKQATEYFKQALKVAQETGNVAREGIWLGSLGNVYSHLGEYKHAVDHHQKALEIARKIGDIITEGIWLGNLGTAYRYLGNYEQAIKNHKQSLDIARKIGDVEGEGSRLINLGTDYRYLGNYQQAIEYHEQALDIVNKIGDIAKKGICLDDLGSVYGNLKQYQKAIDYHKQSLDIARKIGDATGEGTRLGNLGFIYIQLGKYQQATYYTRQALDILIPILNKNDPRIKTIKKNEKIAKKAFSKM